jgi:WD40 repeat protein
MKKLIRIIILIITIIILSGCTITKNVYLTTNTPSATPSKLNTNTPFPTTTSTSTPAPTFTPSPKIISKDNIGDLEISGIIGNGQLLDIYYSKDKTKMLTSFTHSIIIFEPKTLKILCRIISIPQIGYSTITADNKIVVAGSTESTAGKGGGLFKWDANTCELLEEERELEFFPVYFSNALDDRIVSMTASKDGTTMEYRDPNTLEISDSFKYSIGLVDFSSSSKKLAFATPGNVEIFNFEEDIEKPLFKGTIPHERGYYEVQMTLSPNGDYIALGGNDEDGKGIIRIWDTRSGEKIYGYNFDFGFPTVKFINDNVLAIASRRELRLMQVPSLSILSSELFFPEDSKKYFDDIVIEQGLTSDEYVLAMDNGETVQFQMRKIDTNQIVSTAEISSVEWCPGQGAIEKFEKVVEQEIGPIMKKTMRKIDESQVPNGFILPEGIGQVLKDEKTYYLSETEKYLGVNYRNPFTGTEDFILLEPKKVSPIILESIPQGSYLPTLNSDGKILVLVEIVNELIVPPYRKFKTILKTWDLIENKLINEIEPKGEICDLQFLNNGLLITANAIFGSFNIFDIEKGNLIRNIDFDTVILHDVFINEQNSKIALGTCGSMGFFIAINRSTDKVGYILEIK